MAGDWIKMRTDLYRDPKVSVMADLLLDADGDLAKFVDQHCQRQMTVTRNVMRNVTVGALVSVWGVMRLRGKRENDDLVCKGATSSVLDDIADLPGFGAAMEFVGWAVETDTGLVLPRFFEDQNVDPEDTAKKKNAERQARFREKNKDKSNVTDDVTVTHREEKRREEKKETNTKAPRAKRAPRPSKTQLPSDFSVSDRVRDWAAENGHARLDEHFDSFVRKARAKGYEYASWDDAFMEAIRADWAGLQKQQGPPRALSWSEKNDEVIAQLTGRSRGYEPDDRTIDI
jgi:hypothetical protein